VLGISASATSAPPAAWADGDPASDVLPAQDIFFPFQPHVSGPVEAAAFKTVRAAAAAGVRVKVAIIGAALELGLVPNLFGHPQVYAQFLDREIAFNRPQPLLVVMPGGFGVIPAGNASALSGVRIDARHGTDGLTKSAILAVVALARYQGHPITAPSITSSSSSSSAPALLVFGLPAALLILVGVGLFLRGRDRARGPLGTEED
jgi:hypothetical protein